jgi:hypothetical protein
MQAPLEAPMQAPRCPMQVPAGRCAGWSCPSEAADALQAFCIHEGNTYIRQGHMLAYMGGPAYMRGPTYMRGPYI